jgi:hypothetical protein
MIVIKIKNQSEVSAGSQVEVLLLKDIRLVKASKTELRYNEKNNRLIYWKPLKPYFEAWPKNLFNNLMRVCTVSKKTKASHFVHWFQFKNNKKMYKMSMRHFNRSVSHDLYFQHLKTRKYLIKSKQKMKKVKSKGLWKLPASTWPPRFSDIAAFLTPTKLSSFKEECKPRKLPRLKST